MEIIDGCWNCKHYNECEEWCYFWYQESLAGEICDEHERNISSN